MNSRCLMHRLLLVGLVQILAVAALTPRSDEILAQVEIENGRRHVLLQEYTGSRQYILQNARFGQHADVAVLMRYHPGEGKTYTVLTRSGSEKLNGIIDQVLAAEVVASLPPESDRNQLSSANYRVRLLGTEVAGGRSCFVLALAPRTKSRTLIIGKAWIDQESYAVVQLEGQYAASMSLLVGAPRIHEDFIRVNGFWMPGHVRSVTSSFLLGPTELEIRFSNYQL